MSYVVDVQRLITRYNSFARDFEQYSTSVQINEDNAKMVLNRMLVDLRDQSKMLYEIEKDAKDVHRRIVEEKA